MTAEAVTLRVWGRPSLWRARWHRPTTFWPAAPSPPAETSSHGPIGLAATASAPGRVWAGFWPPKPPSLGIFGRSSTWRPRHHRPSTFWPAPSPAAGEPSCPGAICLAASASPSKRLFGGDLNAEAPIPCSGRLPVVVAGLEASAEHFWPAPSPAPREPSFFGPVRLAAFASPSKRILTGVRVAGTFSLRRFRPGGVVACSGGTTEPIFAFASVGVAGTFALRPRSPRHLRQAL